MHTKWESEIHIQLTIIPTTFELNWQYKLIKIWMFDADCHFHSRRIHFPLVFSLHDCEISIPESNVRCFYLYINNTLGGVTMHIFLFLLLHLLVEILLDIDHPVWEQLH